MPSTLIIEDRKSQQQLERQLQRVSDKVANGIPISPPSLDLTQSTLPEIEKKHPYRYDLYRRSLRELATGIPLGELSSRFEIDETELYQTLQGLNNLNRFAHEHRRNLKNLLRPRQRTVFQDLVKSVEEGEARGYVKLPTGSGKTVIFVKLVEALAVDTLVVVPTKLLIHQTHERFRQFAPNVNVNKWYGDKKERGRGVTITTYYSLIRAVESGNIGPGDYPSIILDEAHKALGQKTFEALKYLIPHSLSYGFTATPEYSEDKSVLKLLGREIHSMSIVEGIYEDMLCPFSVVLAETEVDLSNVRVSVVGKEEDYNPSDLEKALNQERLNRSAVTTYGEYFADMPAIAHCCGVSHAIDLAREFNRAGYRADFIHGELSDKERQEKLERYKRGELDILCSAELLIHGFDDPRAVVCLNLAPTLSPLRAEQRSGRVLRLDENNPNKHAIIVDFLHRDRRESFVPISFADVAGHAQINPSGKIIPVPLGTRKFLERSLPSVKGAKVTTDPERVMTILKGKPKIARRRKGWKTAYELSERFACSQSIITMAVKRFRDTNPKWFDVRKDHKSRVREHFSPELCLEVERGVNNKRQKDKLRSDGYTLSNSEVLEKLSLTQDELNAVRRREDESGLPHARTVESSKGKKTTWYHPSFLDFVEKNRAPIDERRRIARVAGHKGYLTLKEAAEFLQMTPQILNQRLNDKQSSIISERQDGTLSIDDVFNIGQSSDIPKIEELPKSWWTLDSHSQALGYPVAQVRDAYESILRRTPKNAVILAVSDTRMDSTEPCYPTDFANKLLHRIENSPGRHPVCPEGWVSCSKLIAHLRVSAHTFEWLIKHFEESPLEKRLFEPKEPEEPAKYYLSPRLSAVLLDTIPPGLPKDWIYAHNAKMSSSLGSKSFDVLAEIIQREHPDQCIACRRSDNINLYENKTALAYSPKFLSLLNSRLESLKGNAPKGWKQINNVGRSRENTNLTTDEKMKILEENGMLGEENYRMVAKGKRLFFVVSPLAQKVILDALKV